MIQLLSLYVTLTSVVIHLVSLYVTLTCVVIQLVSLYVTLTCLVTQLVCCLFCMYLRVDMQLMEGEKNT